jgi:hypothetical protein
MQCERGLLDALDLPVPANKGVEYGKNVTPVFHHAEENIAKLRLALRFTMPLRKHGRRHFNIAAQLFRGVAPQKKAIEKSGFPLRDFEVERDFRRNELGRGGHNRKMQFTQKRLQVK